MGTSTLEKTYYTDFFEVGGHSSNIDAILYDADTSNLFVQFKNGNAAGYRMVSPNTLSDFVAAASPGRFYNQNIRGKFQGVHVDTLVEREDEPAPVKADYGFIYTYEVDVEVTRVEKVQVEAKNVQDALAQAKKVGNPVKISWEL
jgi:hypothetical protein